MPLFDTKKQLATYKRLPDAYYKHVYVSKSLYNGIELIVKIAGISNKAAVDQLLSSRISKYMREKLKEHIENERLNRERAEGIPEIPTLQSIKRIRKYLAEHGMSEYLSKKRGL